MLALRSDTEVLIKHDDIKGFMPAMTMPYRGRDERGEPLALAAWRGSPVAVTFVYTRCPLPQFCPLMDRRFAEVQRLAKADPAVWTFATAPHHVVDTFAAAFGLKVIREADRSITHNLRTAVIDPQGRVVSIYDGSDWTAEHIVTDLRRALPAR